MKVNTFIFLAGSFLISAVSLAQKTNETSAAVEFKQKFQPSLMMGKVDDAKQAILNAKKYIDLASEHPDTKGTAKTLYYKGEIYGGAAQLAMMTGDTSFMMKNFGEDAFEISIASFQESYKLSKKFQPDIDNTVNMQVSMLSPVASKFYEEDKFAEAGAAFYYIYKITTAKAFQDKGLLTRAMNLAHFELLGDAEGINEEAQIYESIMPKHILSVSKKVLLKTNCSLLKVKAI